MFRHSIKCFFILLAITFVSEISAQTGKTLEIKEIEMKGCIQMFFKKQFVITTEEDFLKAVRDDASRDYCLKKVEKIDFKEKTLLGISINSGYCRRPSGLQYETVVDKIQKKVFFNISYIDPQGSVCRALSKYDLWVLIPKLPESYQVEFSINPN